MKIINLKAENLKKIKAIEISPVDNTVIISGKNGAGKSSVLDAIWLALGGKQSSQSKPIREGEKKAEVTLDLGDIEVNRVWTDNETSYLKVTNKKDQAIYQSPQKLLDRLVGSLSFDPLEFSRMSDKEQKSVLLGILGVEKEIEDLTKQYESIYQDRTVVGRMLKQHEGNLASIKVPEEKPAERVIVSDLVKQLEEANKHNQNVTYLNSTLVERKKEQKSIEESIAHLQEQLKDVQAEIAEREEKIKSVQMLDVTPIQEKIEQAESINDALDQFARYEEAEQKVSESKKEYDQKSEDLKAIVTKKEEFISKSKMPIEGLNVTIDGVTFNGIPFSQLSSAEKLKVSLAISMAMKPDIRVIRILDGSLLDSDNMQIVREMADKNDYQVWIEKVADEKGKAEVWIEDGSVVE